MTTDEYFNNLSKTNKSENKRKPYKYKKTLNISIQSPQYYENINKMIEDWYNLGYNISTEVLERLSKMNKIEKSITFSNINNIYELIEKMIDVYMKNDVENKMAVIEKIFSEVIIIDNVRLTESLSSLNKYMFNNMEKTKNNTVNPNNINDRDDFIERPSDNLKDEGNNSIINTKYSQTNKNTTNMNAVNISSKVNNDNNVIDSINNNFIEDGDLDGNLPVDFITNS